MKTAAQPKRQYESSAKLEELYRKRLKTLDEIESKDIVIGPNGNELRSQELRHLIRSPNYHGSFLPMVCDHCYSDLWQDQEKVISCPGCGWVP